MTKVRKHSHSRRIYTRHKRNTCSSKEKTYQDFKSNSCIKCKESFGYLKNLYRHQRIGNCTVKYDNNNNSEQCEICRKTFTLKSNLNKHIKKNICHKIYCEICKVSFKDKESFKRHQRKQTCREPAKQKNVSISFNYKKRKATDDLACNLENSLMRTLIKILLHDKRL